MALKTPLLFQLGFINKKRAPMVELSNHEAAAQYTRSCKYRPRASECDLCDFDHATDVGARWSCLSISETADPWMFTQNSLWRSHRMV